MKKEINLCPSDDYHYFFGFHDLKAWNSENDKVAALRISDIYAPPSGNTPCDVGYLKENEFVKLGETYAYNYPQGARQQWIGKTNLLVVNDKIDNKWGAKVYDTNTNSIAHELEDPVHVVTDEGWAFGIDYARVHRVGGYGYTGIVDESANQHAPSSSGIIKHNVYSKKRELLISIKSIAGFQAKVRDGRHHYLTHLVLNPSQTRIAFLHRCKLPDGGETTRLMTIGVNGEDLRCIASGFLSHFDWKDDHDIAIWGRTGSAIENIRSSRLVKIIPPGILSFGKKVIKKIIYRQRKVQTTLFNWLILSDHDNHRQEYLAQDSLTEDGHPMFCPNNRDWMICDNYPDKNGYRTLFLFQCSTKRKIDLGKYQMLDAKPDMYKSQIALKDIEPSVLKAFSIEDMSFYRSGLHCDLHPRWDTKGKYVAFDSIHEGKRAIYSMDVSAYINDKK